MCSPRNITSHFNHHVPLDFLQDLDIYKATVKDQIAEWLEALRACGISDWLIVVVVNEDSKVKTKILRTLVIDRVKSDFCSKHNDR